jgi:DNA-binding NarL/FixJ family response regulator
LSPRQQELLTYFAAGYSRKLIALRLGIGLGTVQATLRRVLWRLECGSVEDAVRMALERGWIHAPATTRPAVMEAFTSG